MDWSRSPLRGVTGSGQPRRFWFPFSPPSTYEKLREGMLESYAPENTAEQSIVEELANAYWRLLRLHRVENQYWDQLGGCYNRGDAGIAEALLQAPDKQTRNYFRYYAQVERSYYKALAAADQIKRERRDRKPLKTMVATAQNGFVSQNADETETTVAQAPPSGLPSRDGEGAGFT